MAHAVSASSYRSDRMSPIALAMAILLHVLVAAALWWMSQQRDPVPTVEEAIEVSFEQPKPPEPILPEPPKPEPPKPEPPKPVARPQAPTPPPPPIDGLRPPAPITADKPTQAPPADRVSKDPPAPAPPPEHGPSPDFPQLEAAAPPPPVPAPPVEASVQPPPPAPVEKPPEAPPTENGLKAAPTPPPPPAPQATPVPQPQPPQPKPVDPTPVPKPMPQQQQALAAPPVRPPPAPKPELRPSPLSTTPSKRPPSASSQEAPSSHTFVNPADAYSRARVSDNYLSQVVRKLVGYRYTASRTKELQGRTVVQIVIARDGRLVDVQVLQSSGLPEFDSGVMAGVRAGSPYPPLPAEIKGDRASFTVPLISYRGP